MDGLILIDKPRTWTSFDAVNKIRGVTRIKRVGHAGTLDPLATGLLLICIGPACRQIERLTKLDKTYEATLRLGANSTTGDEEGEKTPVSDQRPTEEEIKKVLEALKGPQLQTPPAFSAIKINGQRAYQLARKGKEVKLEPRPVTIHSLELLDYAYPHLKIRTEVSSGTYIRSLAETIGGHLKTGAYLSDLRRTHIGSFSVDDAISVEGITPEQIEQRVRGVPQAD